jgi:hypothetical protein
MSNFSTFIYPDKEEKVNTIRYPQSAFLLIDSLDRYKITRGQKILNPLVSRQEINPNNILINNQKTLGMGSIKRLAVTEVFMPLVTPNVNERNNKLYLFSDSTGEYYYINVDEGFYTPEELADKITSILNDSGWINFDDNLPELGFGGVWNCSVVNGKFKLEAGEDIGNWAIVSYYVDEITLANLMNLLNAGNKNTSTLNFAVGGIPSMAYTKYIDVCSKTLTKYQNLSDTLTQQNYTSILCRIYLSDNNDNEFSCKPHLNYSVQYATPKYIIWNDNEMITSIDIQLYDDAGELYYIPKDEWDYNYILTMQMSES